MSEGGSDGGAGWFGRGWEEDELACKEIRGRYEKDYPVR